MGCMYNWMYAGLFVFVMFAWPLFLFETITPVFVMLIFCLNTIIAVNTWYQCTSPEISFFRGLSAISVSQMSGCANITLLYLPFVLIGVYIISIYYSTLGMLYDRKISQGRFVRLVLWFIDA